MRRRRIGGGAMKQKLGLLMFVKAVAVVVVVVLVTGVLAANGLSEPVDAQTRGGFSGDVVGAADSSDNASSMVSDVAASPAALPLPRSHFVGSVMYKRTVGMERFDTDHDIDGSDGVDREIFGSHYVMGNEFKVRIPTSYSDKPEGVFGVGFSGVSGGAVFSARAVGGVLV